MWISLQSAQTDLLKAPWDQANGPLALHQMCFINLSSVHYLSSCCSLSLSLTFSCPCGAFSVGAHSTPPTRQRSRMPPSRCRCWPRKKKLFLSFEICFLNAAFCLVWELKTQNTKIKPLSLLKQLPLAVWIYWPSVAVLGATNGAMERLVVRFSIWLRRNLRSCIRSSTCRSRAAMRSCLLSSMHCSFVMVSSTRGGKPSNDEAARYEEK